MRIELVGGAGTELVRGQVSGKNDGGVHIARVRLVGKVVGKGRGTRGAFALGGVGGLGIQEGARSHGVGEVLKGGETCRPCLDARGVAKG